MEDFQSGDIICRNCGLVQYLQFCPNNAGYFEDEVNPGSDELIIHMVLMYGFGDGMTTVIERRLEEYKVKVGKRKVYNKEYVVAALIMQETNSYDYGRVAMIFDLDMKRLKDEHYRMNEV